MGIQNNLKATFYGKVGNLVGMRWKDMTTVRKYVIPTNPKTPLQQANRARFRLATEQAQQGMRINKGAPCWEHAHNTEFQFRVKTAKIRIDGGETGWKTIPLFPNGYSPKYEYADLYAVNMSSIADFEVRSNGLASLSVERNLFVGLSYFHVGSSSEEWLYDIHPNIVGSPLVSKGLPPNCDLSKQIALFFISVDDIDFGGDMVYAALQVLN